MLTLIESGFAENGHSELTERIKKSVNGKKKTLLFVPEQQTLSAEKEMCDILPQSAPLLFEVTNFTRFSNTSFRNLGGISTEYCDSAGKALIMWRTLVELSAVLNLTRGRTNISRGAVDSALMAVGEMQSLGITPEELSDADGRCDNSDPRLKAKLSDLSMIYSLYKRLLGERYSDMSDDTLKLAGMLRDMPDYLSGYDIYIDGFTSFTEPQYRLIEEMIRSSSLTVSLTLPKARSSDFEFMEVRRARARLIHIADKLSKDKKLFRLAGMDHRHSELICEMGKLLWRTDGEIDNDCLQKECDEGERVRIFCAENPFDECDFLASDIKRRVMGGASFRDFAIIARNAETYVGILDVSLARAGIPCFLSKRRDISTFEAIKLIYTAYAIISRGYRREDVLTYLKCGMLGISRDDSDEFELYTEKWNIDGRRFTDEGLWNMNPRGYEKLSECDSEKLLKINRLRDKLILPLKEFEENVKASATVTEHARALVTFLTEIKLEEMLIAKAEELFRLSEDEKAEENARLWGIICDSLDRLVETIGEVRADSDSFISQLTVTLGEASIGRIPSHIDEVTVGSADMIRLSGKRHIYLVGVNKGEFPSVATDNSYFSDRDKARLTELGLPIEPDLEIKNARELYCFTRAFTFAEETVTILYSKRTAAMSPSLPSDVIERIGEISSGKIKPQDISSLGIRDRLYTKEDAFGLLPSIGSEEAKEVCRALVECGCEEALALAAGDIKNEKLELGKDAAAIIYKGDLYLSQSRLESFLQCPFKYFCKYNLGLDEKEPAELTSNVIGSFIHAILEDFFRELKKKKLDIASLSDEERNAITERASKRYISEHLGGGYGSERTKVAISRLCRSARPVVDGLCDEFSDCKYVPTFFELSTDGKGDSSASPIIYECDDGGRIIIRGKVDRVDTYKKGEDVYVRVVDYKTGAKEFSPSDIDEGINLQMFLYLKSIVETEKESFRDAIGAAKTGRLIPAGVIYAKTSIKDAVIKHSDDELAKEAAKELSTREGMILDDEDSIGAMNPRFTPLKYPETGRNAASNKAKKYTEEGWGELNEAMRSVILNITDEMKKGNIKASAKTVKGMNPCEFCSYRAVCRSAR